MLLLYRQRSLSESSTNKDPVDMDLYVMGISAFYATGLLVLSFLLSSLLSELQRLHYNNPSPQAAVQQTALASDID